MSAGRIARVLARLVIGGAIAAGAGLAAYMAVVDTHTADAHRHGIALTRLLAAALAGVTTIYGLTLAISLRPWPRARWAARAAILAEAVFLWFAHDQLSVVEWAVAAGVLALLVLAHYVAHRHALGWIIDEDGERQKVDHLVRGRPIFTPTTWKQRLVDEGVLRSERRAALGWSLLFAVPIASAAYWLWSEQPKYKLGAEGLAVVAGLILAIRVLPNLLPELLYLAGYQDMRGHKVLDPEVRQPDKYDVAREMAHGDASLAGELEALGFLQKGR